LDFGPFNSFRFDSLYNVNPVPEVYAQDTDRMTNGPYEVGDNVYYYVNTFHNAGTYRYLNTKQRIDSNPNVDARTNDEAIYKDGHYTVWVRGWNIRGIGGNEQNRTGAEDVDILIDKSFSPPIFENPHQMRISEVKYSVKF
jgi:hypothetical protein